MAFRLFPFATAVSQLITPSKRTQTAPSRSSSVSESTELPDTTFTEPQSAPYESEPLPTEQEVRDTAPLLFVKSAVTRFTFSKFYKRILNNNNEILQETYIPKLPDEGIKAALKKLRSEIFPKIVNLPPALYELNNNPETWGELAPYIWYNVLLGPYEYDRPYSKKIHFTDEDQFDLVDDSNELEAEMNILPPDEKLGNSEMLYWRDVIMCGHNSLSDTATFFILHYQTLTEDQIVDYLRAKRREFDQKSETFMFILFHNLLIPYVFGKK
jgi:hypothetical protein